MPFTNAELFQYWSPWMRIADTECSEQSKSKTVVGIYLELPPLFSQVGHGIPLLQAKFLDLLIKDGAWPRPRSYGYFYGAMW